MVLVNAVALDAPWEFPFDPAATSDAPFTRPDGTTVDVPTMHYDEYLPSATTDTYQAVELPYGGGALSMVVIVPHRSRRVRGRADRRVAGRDARRRSRTAASTCRCRRGRARTHVTLNDTLAALGMPTAFGAGADFSGMVDGGGLWIDRVEHEAVRRGRRGRHPGRGGDRRRDGATRTGRRSRSTARSSTSSATGAPGRSCSSVASSTRRSPRDRRSGRRSPTQRGCAPGPVRPEFNANNVAPARLRHPILS